MFDQAPIDRRDFLKYTGIRTMSILAAPPLLSACDQSYRSSVQVNDAMAGITPTRVRRVVRPENRSDLREILADSTRDMSISGTRHSMGGQPFGKDTLHLDMRSYGGIESFSPQNRTVTVKSGTGWPALVHELIGRQESAQEVVTIRQKQTGANHFTIGGSLATNIHGRGLSMQPMVSDIESFRLIDAEGRIRTCSRDRNAELFSLAIGGYGLFGVVDTVTLRLKPRRKLRRTVEQVSGEQIIPSFQRKRTEGFRYGDVQLSVDPKSDTFLRSGLLSCYKPVQDSEEPVGGNKSMSENEWLKFVALAHRDPGKGWERYRSYQKRMNGKLLWSDYQYFTQYVKHYHEKIDRMIGSEHAGSEVISEFHVPRNRLTTFLDQAASYLRDGATPVIYAVVRLIEEEDQTFLNWADQDYACVLLNLHVNHNKTGRKRARAAVRELLDRAISLDGGYYLTYTRWPTKSQITDCYPQFPEFLEKKREYDPGERFQSEWYRHYKSMFQK